MIEQKKLGLNGNDAVAYAIRQCAPDVIVAYPITPQTSAVQKLSKYIADGVLDAEFIPVESEHSSMSACFGAAAAGARVFTATSSQGLALMSEIVYIVASSRLPVVMALSNRALSAPINIHPDYSDSMLIRDSGWIQLIAHNVQSTYDLLITAYRIGEHEDVQLPVAVNYEGFEVSHTLENLEVLPDEAVQKFIGQRKPLYRLDPKRPLSIGTLGLPDAYMENKYEEQVAMEHAHDVIKEVFKEYGELTGRYYDLVETYKMEDAEMAIVGMGSVTGTMAEVVDALREEGKKVGLVRVRVFRPFPAAEIREALKGVKKVAVFDRAASFGGAKKGPLHMEVVASLGKNRPDVVGFVAGLGGRPVTEANIREMFEKLEKANDGDSMFIGVRWDVV